MLHTCTLFSLNCFYYLLKTAQSTEVSHLRSGPKTHSPRLTVAKVLTNKFKHWFPVAFTHLSVKGSTLAQLRETQTHRNWREEETCCRPTQSCAKFWIDFCDIWKTLMTCMTFAWWFCGCFFLSELLSVSRYPVALIMSICVMKHFCWAKESWVGRGLVGGEREEWVVFVLACVCVFVRAY